MSLSAYIHLPWCEKKCPYCDFNSYEGEVREEDYVAALLRDMDFETQSAAPTTISSVFFGGGTPSLFSAESIGTILDGLAARTTLRADAEVTLEANPGSAEAARFRAYRAAGVNRLSIGIQSFDDRSLARIGRVHDSAMAQRAIGAAREAGFDNLNLDLMYRLPGQSLDQALRDLDLAIDHRPEHLSWYELTIEPGTAFGRKPPVRPDEDAGFEMTRDGAARIRSAGFARYEVSAWAQPGRRSQHNLNYWRFGDYLGLGAGAHGKRSVGPVITRRAKLRSPSRFMRAAGSAAALANENCPAPEELRCEFALNALRLNDGFPLSLYRKTTGRDPAELESGLAQARRLGLAVSRNGRIRPTRLGRLHLNRLIECWA